LRLEKYIMNGLPKTLQPDYLQSSEHSHGEARECLEPPASALFFPIIDTGKSFPNPNRKHSMSQEANPSSIGPILLTDD